MADNEAEGGAPAEAAEAVPAKKTRVRSLLKPLPGSRRRSKTLDRS